MFANSLCHCLNDFIDPIGLMIFIVLFVHLAIKLIERFSVVSMFYVMFALAIALKAVDMYRSF